MGARRAGMVGLRASLVNSNTFQQLTKTVGYPELTDARVYDHVLPRDPGRGEAYSKEELAALRPYALLYNAQGGPYATRDAAAGACFATGGVVELKLVRTAPKLDPAGVEGPVDEQQSMIQWEEIVDDILDEIADQADEAGKLNAQRIMSTGPLRTIKEKLKEIGDEQIYHANIQWGQLET